MWNEDTSTFLKSSLRHRLFVDTANAVEASEAIATGAVVGVTTNQSLVAKEKRDVDTYESFVVGFIKAVAETFSVSTTSTVERLSVSVAATRTGMRGTLHDGGLRLFKAIGELDRGVRIEPLVKVAISYRNLSTVRSLVNAGVGVNATCCVSASQAKMAFEAGAIAVSFFYRRMCDEGRDAEREIGLTRELFDGRGVVICGSIREPADVLSCWKFGAQVVTVPPKVLRAMADDVLSDRFVAKFEGDMKTWLA